MLNPVAIAQNNGMVCCFTGPFQQLRITCAPLQCVPAFLRVALLHVPDMASAPCTENVNVIALVSVRERVGLLAAMNLMTVG